MGNSFLNIVLGVSAGAVSLLAFADEMGKNKSFRLVKTLRFKIVAVILAIVFGILASIAKDNNTDQQSKKDKVESDSSQKALIKIMKDSLKQRYEGELPTIAMIRDGKLSLKLTKDKQRFIATFISENATSRNVNLVASFLDSDDSINFSYKGRLPIMKEISLPKDKYLEINITKDPKITPIIFTMWCRGTYTDNIKSETLSYDEMIWYNTKTGYLVIPTWDVKNKLINKIKESEKF